jgi:hypothetical protein
VRRRDAIEVEAETTDRQLEPQRTEPWPNGRKGDPLEGASALVRPGTGPLDAVRGAGTAERRSVAGF